jgi:hypothetical protein
MGPKHPTPSNDNAKSVDRWDDEGGAPIGGSHPRPKRRPKVIFDIAPMKVGGEWQLRAHLPGAVTEYITGFKTEAEAEAWPASPEAKAWKRAKGYSDD